nr:GNAT family N-acetyltransferase [Micromonospora sp. S-DT3-3-22]
MKPPPWQRFTTTDVDEVLAFFRASFADVSIMHSAVGAEGVQLRGMGTMLGDVALNGLHYSAGVEVSGIAREFVRVIQVRAGRLVVTDGRDTYRVTPGHVVLLPTDVTLKLECDALESFTVGLPTTLIEQVARGREGPGAGVRFESLRPMSRGLERHWLGTLAYVRQVVLADDDLAGNPLIVRQVRHMLATAALAVFPSNSSVPRQRDPGTVSPAVVRRAMDYVQAHTDRYVSLAELAEAAGVSARGCSTRSAATTTPPRPGTPDGSGWTAPTATCSTVTRRPATPSRRSPPGGDSWTRSGSPPTTVPPTASRRATPCGPDPAGPATGRPGAAPADGPRPPVRRRSACLDGRVEFTVTDAPDRERFEARDETGALAGVVTYQLTGAIIAYTHTEVDPAFEGRGVGSTLARAVMDDARSRGRTVVPICPFLADWLGRHPEYADIVARSTRRIR